MNSHGVEIPIAGYIEKMVRNPNPMPFFYFYFYFYFFFIMRSLFLGIRSFVQR